MPHALDEQQPPESKANRRTTPPTLALPIILAVGPRHPATVLRRVVVQAAFAAERDRLLPRIHPLLKSLAARLQAHINPVNNSVPHRLLVPPPLHTFPHRVQSAVVLIQFPTLHPNRLAEQRFAAVASTFRDRPVTNDVILRALAVRPPFAIRFVILQEEILLSSLSTARTRSDRHRSRAAKLIPPTLLSNVVQPRIQTGDPRLNALQRLALNVDRFPNLIRLQIPT